MADATIYKQNSTTNDGTGALLHIRRWAPSYSERSVIRFDLSSIGASATISSATLRLVIRTNSGHVKDLNIYPITAAWTESAVTWSNIYFAFTPGPGTDSAQVGAYDTAGLVVTWDVTPDVATFVVDPASNRGWIIMDSLDQLSGAGEEVNFDSREGTIPPELQVCTG